MKITFEEQLEAYYDAVKITKLIRDYSDAFNEQVELVIRDGYSMIITPYNVYLTNTTADIPLDFLTIYSMVQWEHLQWNNLSLAKRFSDDKIYTYNYYFKPISGSDMELLADFKLFNNNVSSMTEEEHFQLSTMINIDDRETLIMKDSILRSDEFNELGGGLFFSYNAYIGNSFVQDVKLALEKVQQYIKERGHA